MRILQVYKNILWDLPIRIIKDLSDFGDATAKDWRAAKKADPIMLEKAIQAAIDKAKGNITAAKEDAQRIAAENGVDVDEKKLEKTILHIEKIRDREIQNAKWSHYNLRAGMIATKLFEIVFKPSIKLFEYGLASQFGYMGALFDGKKGKERGQEIATDMGKKLWSIACRFARPIKKRAFATAGLGVVAITAAFSEISETKAYASKFSKKVSEASLGKAFGLICLEVLSIPATTTFIISKFLFCGSLGLVCSLLAGKEARDSSIVFGKLCAYGLQSFTSWIPNRLSKYILHERISMVETRNEAFLDAKYNAVMFINKSQRGHNFLKNWCGQKNLPDLGQLQMRVQEMADGLNAAVA